MGKGGDEIQHSRAILRCLSWPTCWWPRWYPDSLAWWPQLLPSGWHPPTCSQGYDPSSGRGIKWYCWDVALKSKKLPDDENRLPNFWTVASKVDYRTVAIHWSHPEPCARSLADYEHSVVTDDDVASHHWHEHVGNTPTAGSLGNRMRPSSSLGAN